MFWQPKYNFAEQQTSVCAGCPKPKERVVMATYFSRINVLSRPDSYGYVSHWTTAQVKTCHSACYVSPVET